MANDDFDNKNTDSFFEQTNQAEDFSFNKHDDTHKHEESNKKRKIRKYIEFTQAMQNAGYSALRMMDTVDEEDDYAKAGQKAEEQFKKYGTGMLDIVGADALYKSLIEKQNIDALITNTYITEIARGHISLEDVTKSKDIYDIIKKNRRNAALDSTSFCGIYGNELKGRKLKHSKIIYDNIITRDAILEFAKTKEGKKAFSNNKRFADMNNFFGGKEKTRKMREKSIETYFRHHSDTMFNSISIMRLSDKQLKKLVSQLDTTKFSKEISILNTYLRDRNVRKAGRAANLRKSNARYFFANEVKNKLLDTHSAEYAGISNIKRLYDTGKMVKSSVKASFVTSRLVGRGGKSLARLVILKPILFIARKLGITDKILSSRPYKSITHATTKVKDKKKKVTDNLDNLRKKPSYLVDNATSAVSNSIVNSTAGKAVNKVIVKPTKVIAKPFKVVAKPIKFIFKIHAKINMLATKIKITIGVTIGILLLIYLILLIISGFLLGAFSSASETTTTIVYTDESNMTNLQTIINDLDQNELQKCIDYATRTDHSIAVSGGKTTDHYGSPDHPEYYEINYLNSSGNSVGNKISNFKDILCITCAVFQYDLTDHAKVEKFINDLYKIMCPDPTYVDSPIYYCSAGCYTHNYKCNNSSHYNTMNSWFNDGVHKYGSLVAQSQGCSVSHYTCKGHPSGYNFFGIPITSYCSHSNMSSPCSNCKTHYKCNGHNITLCFGHRDLEINNILYFKEDLYNGIINLPTSNEYKDYVTLFNSSGGFDYYSSWIDSLYNQDWYELYGIDTNGGVGFDPAVVLPEEEIVNILSGINVSQSRQDVVSYGLDSVGKIPYYFGGKASCKGWDGNNFGVTITKDYKGRTKKGLDCSGFVGWVIWSVLDIDAHGCGTSTIQAKIGGHQIKASELQPGDLGFKFKPGTNGTVNHIGIYAGTADGKRMWIHCNGSDNNVSYDDTNCWSYYWNWLD